METSAKINWDEVVEDLGPALLRYFLASGFSRAQSSDGVQETLLRLVRLAREGEYDPKRGSPRMLAFGIARLVKHEFYRNVGEHDLFGDTNEYANQISDQGRSSGFGGDLPNRGGTDDGAPSVLRTLEENEANQRLRRAIHSLDHPVKEIFLLLIDRELRLEEISGILSLPVGTVKSHIHRGKEKLRAILENDLASEKVTHHE